MISIRRQLTRELLGSCLVLLGGGLAAVFIAARTELIEEFDSALRAKASAVISSTELDEGALKVDLSDQILRGFTGEHPRDYFQLWREDGVSPARSDSLHGADLPRPVARGERPRFWNFTLPNGQPVRAVSLSFAPRGQEGEPILPGTATLQITVASNRDDLDEALTELLSIAAVCGILLLVATLWVVPRVLKRGLQPLDRLAELATQIDAHSLTARFPAAGLPAELQPICGRLNDLLARLEASFERERRFSADLAHELRTPLAELRTLAECSLKWPETRDPASDRDTLAIAAQMESVVTTLLALTRGEQGRLPADLKPVALVPLIEETWRSFAVRAEARGLRVHLKFVPLSAPADPALLRSILGNLFDNAVDYTPPGGEITFDLRADGQSVLCTLANTTDNLEPSDVPKLFDRFWRKEAARTGGKHFGLGLSLAATFARSMGWSLSASLAPSGQLVFSLRSPAAPLASE